MDDFVLRLIIRYLDWLGVRLEAVGNVERVSPLQILHDNIIITLAIATAISIYLVSPLFQETRVA
jgi:hypothetical protein